MSYAPPQVLVVSANTGPIDPPVVFTVNNCHVAAAFATSALLSPMPAIIFLCCTAKNDISLRASIIRGVGIAIIAWGLALVLVAIFIVSCETPNAQCRSHVSDYTLYDSPNFGYYYYNSFNG
ncbi:hypothetical protein HDU84_003317, partial [Entophlyctis sp. JEL0112]